MVTVAPEVRRKRKPAPTQAVHNGHSQPGNSSYWPLSGEEAYRRCRGRYTIANTGILLEEEPLELYNGWLVWQEMTDPEERRVAANIQEILSLAARAARYGQAYPDQLECLMVNEDLYKPDVCLISHRRFDEQVGPAVAEKPHKVLKGGPELVVEIRSPSNRRRKERRKRRVYFENGTLVVWDVDTIAQKIWVYEVENPEQGREYKTGDTLSCEQVLPGWSRLVDDFFAKDLSAEQVVGQVAEQWRAESHAQGEAEGELKALRSMVVRQARLKFGAEQLPAELETRLSGYTVEQLTALSDALMLGASLEQWLATFPV
jgi:Uma2 family endonuclease